MTRADIILALLIGPTICVLAPTAARLTLRSFLATWRDLRFETKQRREAERTRRTA